jgi:hypothetical protein
LERVVPNVIARFCETTSVCFYLATCSDYLQRELRNPRSAVSLVVVVSSVSPVSSTKKPEVSSRSSLKASSAMLSPTPSMPSERPLHPSMSYMPSSVKDAPSTDSVVKYVMGWWRCSWVCFVVRRNPDKWI